MTADRVLTRRELNRALLARQLLLERSSMPVAGAVAWLVGLQAQTPLAPYVALWSRLAAFDPGVLSGLLERREAVRMGLFRTTIHLVTARDAHALRPVLQSVLDRAWSASGFARNLAGLQLDGILAESRRLLEAEPMTASALGARLAQRWPDAGRDSLGYAARFLLPLVQVPPRGLWKRTGVARHTTLDAWTGRGPDAAPSVDELVLRYLAAFGPASVGDLRTWSWLTGLREVVERLRPRLRPFRDERGRELFDVPGGALPDPDRPAPPRFLPDYDNLVLSHEDRTRIVPDTVRRQVPWGWGALLVDGFVSGTWKVTRTKEVATLEVKTFRSFRDAEAAEVVAEGTMLLGFLAADLAPGGVLLAVDPDQQSGRTR